MHLPHIVDKSRLVTYWLYRQYTYIVGKYKIYLYKLLKRPEKRACAELFFPVSRRVEIYFIFLTVYMYCVYTATS
jgi:hypothetical protein